MHVIRGMWKYAVQLRTTGTRTHYSIYAIRERLRWDSMLREEGTEYKISNNITPHVARLLMVSDKRLAGMFKVKGSNQ